MIQYGGEGLTLQHSLLLIREYLGEGGWNLINDAMTLNPLKLLCWFEKKVVVQEVKMWTCVKCGKESPETEEAFRKFGKDFCSIGCLRGYKF